jgi:AraC-like DNA-binding protein
MKGQFEVEIASEVFLVAPEQLLLVPTRAPCKIRFLCDEDEHSLIAIDFSRAIVDKVAQETTGSMEPFDFCHGGLVDETKGIGITLIMTIRSLIAGLGEHGTFHHKPLTVKLLSESILHLLYECMTQQPGVNRVERAQDGTPRHLKAAVEYIEDNLHRSLTVSEIAAAVGISIRALQASFQRHLHTTPLRHLRQVRLEHAHRELSSPANRLPIGEVAHKWGFNHLGRFSSHYRALYGESPSSTVKRAQCASAATVLAQELDTPSPQARQPSIEAAE